MINRGTLVLLGQYFESRVLFCNLINLLLTEYLITIIQANHTFRRLLQVRIYLDIATFNEPLYIIVGNIGMSGANKVHYIQIFSWNIPRLAFQRFSIESRLRTSFGPHTSLIQLYNL